MIKLLVITSYENNYRAFIKAFRLNFMECRRISRYEDILGNKGNEYIILDYCDDHQAILSYAKTHDMTEVTRDNLIQ